MWFERMFRMGSLTRSWGDIQFLQHQCGAQLWRCRWWRKLSSLLVAASMPWSSWAFHPRAFAWPSGSWITRRTGEEMELGPTQLPHRVAGVWCPHVPVMGLCPLIKTVFAEVDKFGLQSFMFIPELLWSSQTFGRFRSCLYRLRWTERTWLNPTWWRIRRVGRWEKHTSNGSKEVPNCDPTKTGELASGYLT